MRVRKRRGLVLFLLILLFIPFVLAQVYDRTIAGESGDGKGRVIALYPGQAEMWYNNNTNDMVFDSYRIRGILGQRFIGIGWDDIVTLSRVELGFMKLLNYRTVINETAINANKTLVKHPYTNDTLACEYNITEKDIGDKLEISITWYKNSSAWYPNNETNINYSNLDDLITEYGVTFERWGGDNETHNHTMIASVFYSMNSSHHNRSSHFLDTRSGAGSLEPDDIKHYDLWICSVDAFDQVAHSGWSNSSPMFIFNRQPDYNDAMPTYYAWPEDTIYTIDLGTNFSDIDSDDINWYVNWTSNRGAGRYDIRDIGIAINNVSGVVTLTPNANISGIMDIVFTGVDNNMSHTSDWYLNNDYGHTNTSVFRFNVTQVNDPPWASDVFIDSPSSDYMDTLTCQYDYNDIENHPENTTALSFKWWHQDEGAGGWSNLDVNSSTLSPTYFDLADKIICSVHVKDFYYDWDSLDQSLWDLVYRNSTAITIAVDAEIPKVEQGELVVAIG